jgi:hypothetical protein
VIQKLISSIWNKEELSDQWKESVILPTQKKRGEKSDKYRDECALHLSWCVRFFDSNTYVQPMLSSPNAFVIIAKASITLFSRFAQN